MTTLTTDNWRARFLDQGIEGLEDALAIYGRGLSDRRLMIAKELAALLIIGNRC